MARGVLVGSGGGVKVGAGGGVRATDAVAACPDCDCGGDPGESVYIIGAPCKASQVPNQPVIVERARLQAYYTTKYGSATPPGVPCAVVSVTTNLGSGCYRFGLSMPGTNSASGAYLGTLAFRENCCTCVSDCITPVQPPYFPNLAPGVTVTLQGQRPCCVASLEVGDQVRTVGSYQFRWRGSASGNCAYDLNWDEDIQWDQTIVYAQAGASDVTVGGVQHQYGFWPTAPECQTGEFDPGPYDRTKSITKILKPEPVTGVGPAQGLYQRFNVADRFGLSYGLAGLTGSIVVSCNSITISLFLPTADGFQQWTLSETLYPVNGKGCGQGCGANAGGSGSGASVTIDRLSEMFA